MLDIIQYKVNVYNVIFTHNCASVMCITPILIPYPNSNPFTLTLPT